MHKADKLNNRITKCIVINILLLIAIFIFLPMIIDSGIELCVFKNLFNTECWNCGMTRAFLSVLKLDFASAINYNKNVIFVFPLIVISYGYFWYKYVFRRGIKK